MEYLLIPIAVFFIALVFSMFGMGGGLFYMPVFLFFLKGHAGASLFSFLCIFVTTLSAMSVYHRKGLIDWRLVGYLGVPLVTVVFVSGMFVRETAHYFLKDILGLTLVLAGFFMVLPVKDIFRFKKMREGLNRRFADGRYGFSPMVLTPLVVLIGFLSGLSGVAGGVFEIPIMIGLLGVSAQTAVATSSAIVTMVAVSGIAGRMMLSRHSFGLSASLVVLIVSAALIGGQIGPKISTKLDKQVFKKICGIFVLLMGILFVLK